MKVSADLLRGYTDVILLRRLAEEDSYGYRINRQVAGISGGAVELNEATLYTSFRRMEAGGWIRSYWGTEGAGARRRYYALTDAGRQRLREETEAWEKTREVLNELICEEEGGKAQ